MTVLKSIFVACLMVALFVSCDADSKDKVISDSKSMMKDMTVVLKTITDKTTAEAAKPKLVELMNKGKGLETRLKALNLDQQALNAETAKDQEAIKLMKAFVAEMVRIKGLGEAYKILEATMVKL